jgi:T4-like virus Myoviridae tail sheath stabiliser
MEFFYDGQLRRYLTQFMRLMSNFSYQDGTGKLVQIPVRYGDMSRQVSQIMKKNSENVVNSAPFIACYIKNFEYARDRVQDPTNVSAVNIRERAYDSNGNEYLNMQGANYTVERMMPTPYNITFAADIWTTNTEQKLQILEQILVLFNPAMEIQTTNNYIDWTSISYLEQTGITWSSRQVPQGTESDIDIASISFLCPAWISTPVKVKKLGIITKIISNIFDETTGAIAADATSWSTPASTVYVTPGNYSVLILNNTARLVRQTDTLSGNEYVQLPTPGGNRIVWDILTNLYPGQFRSGLSQIRLGKPDGDEIAGFISINPTDEAEMIINFDGDTMNNTPISDLTNSYSRGNVDAIINPTTYDPGTPALDTRYLILEDINTNPDNDPDLAYALANYTAASAWKNHNGTYLVAHANDIIQWDGSKWNVIFNSLVTETVTYITNLYTGIQYKWDGENWSKSYEGLYEAGNWRLVL